MTNEIERKHFEERDAIIDEALDLSMKLLVRAQNKFGAAIQDRELQNEFAEGIGKAQDVLIKLGVEFGGND
jgi:hypothetical protein